ncbi:MAG TPA: hypothetical protein VHB27_04615 [Rhodopila sp.]|uniref:hypothetical protein n=1 Tax=Rhodopila sp. TaxID=2480087 RepID=UPI002B779EB2|nr:hypothetical protein [Rhodopila sp.]HVY14486.1 hypothetical protein [Rhodopila sp.]
MNRAELGLAGWLPDPVKSWIEANRNHPEHVANAQLIDRLANDSSLQSMWRELHRRKPDGSWVHTVNAQILAKICDVSENDRDECQGIALIFLFKQILHVAVTLYPARVEAEVAASTEDYLRRARALRIEAEDTARLPPGAGGIDWNIAAASMRAKADVLEQAASEAQCFAAVVPNARKNLTGLQAASRLSTIVRTLYGEAMPHQAAAIASALTGESVTYEQVRHLNRQQPGNVKFLRS